MIIRVKNHQMLPTILVEAACYLFIYFVKKKPYKRIKIPIIPWDWGPILAASTYRRWTRNCFRDWIDCGWLSDRRRKGTDCATRKERTGWPGTWWETPMRKQQARRAKCLAWVASWMKRVAPVVYWGPASNQYVACHSFWKAITSQHEPRAHKPWTWCWCRDSWTAS